MVKCGCYLGNPPQALSASPLLTPLIVPHRIPHLSPLQEFRLLTQYLFISRKCPVRNRGPTTTSSPLATAGLAFKIVSMEIIVGPASLNPESATNTKYYKFKAGINININGRGCFVALLYRSIRGNIPNSSGLYLPNLGNPDMRTAPTFCRKIWGAQKAYAEQLPD